LEPTELSQIARTTNDNAYNLIANDSNIIDVVLETSLTQKRGGTLVCGSIGEIAADPAKDDYFDNWNRRVDASGSESEFKKTIWTNIALFSKDQLRQRIAFALSQIFAISPGFLAYPSLSEGHLYYYDIFVRHATTTYKDLLHEVSFSINMGRMLSFVGSASVRLGFDSSRRIRFPDENFAREVMQLYTVWS